MSSDFKKLVAAKAQQVPVLSWSFTAVAGTCSMMVNLGWVLARGARAARSKVQIAADNVL